jgi:hypothetical protein
MGFQGFSPDASGWYVKTKREFGPEPAFAVALPFLSNADSRKVLQTQRLNLPWALGNFTPPTRSS